MIKHFSLKNLISLIMLAKATNEYEMFLNHGMCGEDAIGTPTEFCGIQENLDAEHELNLLIDSLLSAEQPCVHDNAEDVQDIAYLSSCDTIQLINESMNLVDENTYIDDESINLICENTHIVDENTHIDDESINLVDENTHIDDENTLPILDNNVLEFLDGIPDTQTATASTEEHPPKNNSKKRKRGTESLKNRCAKRSANKNQVLVGDKCAIKKGNIPNLMCEKCFDFISSIDVENDDKICFKSYFGRYHMSYLMYLSINHESFQSNRVDEKFTNFQEQINKLVFEESNIQECDVLFNLKTAIKDKMPEFKNYLDNTICGYNCKNQVSSLISNYEKIEAVLSNTNPINYNLKIKEKKGKNIISNTYAFSYKNDNYISTEEDRIFSLEEIDHINRNVKKKKFIIELGYFYKKACDMAECWEKQTYDSLEEYHERVKSYVKALVYNYNKLKTDRARQQSMYILIIEKFTQFLQNSPKITSNFYDLIMDILSVYEFCPSFPFNDNIFNIFRLCDFEDSEQKLKFIFKLNLFYLSIEELKGQNAFDILRMYRIVRKNDTTTYLKVTFLLFKNIDEIKNNKVRRNFLVLCENFCESVFLNRVFDYKGVDAAMCLKKLYFHHTKYNIIKNLVEMIKMKVVRKMTVSDFLTPEYTQFYSDLCDTKNNRIILPITDKMTHKLSREGRYTFFCNFSSSALDCNKKFDVFRYLAKCGFLLNNCYDYILENVLNNRHLYLNFVICVLAHLEEAMNSFNFDEVRDSCDNLFENYSSMFK